MDLERMASIGFVAASVAHDINNLLVPMVANLDLALREVEELVARLGSAAAAGELYNELREARPSAELVRGIALDLKRLARSDEEDLSPVAVRKRLDFSSRPARNEIRCRARLIKEYQPLPAVQATEARLGQLFLNLIVNAAQAIPEGHADENEIRIVARRDDRGCVVVEIRDTGCGM